MSLFEYEHALLTLAWCAIVGILRWPTLAVAAAPILFLGREHAQAEYRWIEHLGAGRRANMPWWGGFDPAVWTPHDWWWNLGLPIVVAVLCALAIQRWRSRQPGESVR